MIFRSIIIIFLTFVSAQAMLYDGIHKDSDYVALAYSDPAFNAACCIYDSKNRIQQSGVLIASDIIATAAHGMVETLKSAGISLYDKPSTIVPVGEVKAIFNVNGRQIGAAIEAVIIDTRYLMNDSGQESKFDIAFAKLRNPIVSDEITPAQLMLPGYLDNNTPLTVVTHGNADKPSNFAWKRAFILPEMDVYHPSHTDDEYVISRRSILISSLFFKPNEKLLKPDEYQADEQVIRSYYANKTWQQTGKLPYAMALSGTSGAPVFVKINGQTYLLGIITSFSHISGQFQTYKGKEEVIFLLQNPEIAYNSYMTIFALFYKQSNDPRKALANKRYYELDQDCLQIIENLRSYAQKYKGTVKSWLLKWF